MVDFTLNEQIAVDTYMVMETDYCYLGLHKNALVPWLILVPKTSEVELFLCSVDFKRHIREMLDDLANFCQEYFNADKMNVATLGNIVSQLHVHIVARKKTDFAWPDPVWGKSKFLEYEEKELLLIIKDIKQHLSKN